MTLRQLQTHIEAIVDYNWKDEKRDYQQQIEFGELDPSALSDDVTHVFVHLKALAEFIGWED